MKNVELKTLLQILGVLVAGVFYFWANYLTNPIEGKSASDLSTEVTNSISSSIAAMFKEAFDEPYKVEHTSFDLFWNLGLPFILFLSITTILAIVCFFILKSIFTDTDSTWDKGIKFTISIALTYLTVMSGIRSFDLLLLNITVTATAVFLFILFVGMIIAPFSNDSRSS